jgi:hypothetical protein
MQIIVMMMVLKGQRKLSRFLEHGCRQVLLCPTVVQDLLSPSLLIQNWLG